MHKGPCHPTCPDPQAQGLVQLTIYLQAGQRGVDSQHLSQGGPAGAEGDVADARVPSGEGWVPAAEEQRTVVTRGTEEDALSFIQVLCPGCQEVLNILGRKEKLNGILSTLCGLNVALEQGQIQDRVASVWPCPFSRAHRPCQALQQQCGTT